MTVRRILPKAPSSSSSSSHSSCYSSAVSSLAATAAALFLVVAALAEQSHAAALLRRDELLPLESAALSPEQPAASRSKRSAKSLDNDIKAVLHSLEAQGYSLPDMSSSSPGEILDFIRRHYVLIKTNDGYILGRNTRKRAGDGMKLLRRADNNFQLRVRKRGSNSNFQLRVRKPFPSGGGGGGNFQLRVRKRSGGYDGGNFQMRVRRPFESSSGNNFQLRVRKAYPSADSNFQLRVRKAAYPQRVAKAMPGGNFQLRVRKAMPADNFQLRVRKKADSGIDLDENEMEAYQMWLNQMMEDGRLEKRDYEELGSDDDDEEEEEEEGGQGMKK